MNNPPLLRLNNDQAAIVQNTPDRQSTRAVQLVEFETTEERLLFRLMLKLQHLLLISKATQVFDFEAFLESKKTDEANAMKYWMNPCFAVHRAKTAVELAYNDKCSLFQLIATESRCSHFASIVNFFWAETKERVAQLYSTKAAAWQSARAVHSEVSWFVQVSLLAANQPFHDIHSAPLRSLDSHH